MGKTVTVNLDEAVQKKFKEKAILKYGNRKGALAKALNEALEQWLKSDGKDVLGENLRLLDTGIEMKKWKFKREDLYER
ncbi:MAG: hypothetical protein ACYCT2_04970 [Thermoplasmataceae archaeon]